MTRKLWESCLWVQDLEDHKTFFKCTEIRQKLSLIHI